MAARYLLEIRHEELLEGLCGKILWREPTCGAKDGNVVFMLKRGAHLVRGSVASVYTGVE